MIARVSRASSGLSKYLFDGRRKDSEYSRDQKDHTIPLFGDLDIFEKTETFLNTHKDFKYNYMHITLSFSKEDMRRIEESGLNREDVYRDMVETYIKHHTSGYDLDNEVIAYAEAHIPKIKEEHNKERLDHIHIAIALYNPRDNTKLRTDFKTSNFLDDTLQEYVNKKHGLTNPRESSRIREGINANTDMAKNRKYYQEALKDVQSKEQLIDYFKENKIEFREVETAKNHYFKIITPGDEKDINLRGKGFEHLSDIAQGKEIAANAKRRSDELEKILTDHYEKRIDQIHGRRSAVSKMTIETLYEEENERNGENVIYSSFKQKLFQKHYGKETTNKFNGYQIDLNSESGVKFTNSAKGIEVIDRGDKITGGNSKNVKEQAKLMLDIAEAKGWKLNALGIKGTAAFKKEVHRQIAERIKQSEELIIAPEITDIQRPTSMAEKIAADHHDEKKVEDLALSIDLAAIKSDLKAAAVLQYAAEKYKLDPKKFEIAADNKINNLTNKQKPKNVIDFIQKELNLSGKEAIQICAELLKNQPLDIQTVPIKTNPINKDIHEYTTTQRRVALRKPNPQSDPRQNKNTGNNLPVLSDVKLVSDIKPIGDIDSIKLLLQINVHNHLQRQDGAFDNGVRYTAIRNDSTAGGSVGKIDGELAMALKLSICKDANANALNKWETVEVSNYTELATLMKQYPYSAAQFDKGYRNLENATSTGNVLIYDIDNDKGESHLSIEEARTLLEKQGISAMILPSQSNNKEKAVRKSKASFDGETHVAERYRIIIPTAETLPVKMDKDAFREFQKLTAASLGLEKFVDPKALNDKARFYYKSPVAAVPHVIKSNQVLQIEPFVKKAQKNLNERRVEAERERLRIAQIRRNIDKHRQTDGESASTHLTRADVDKLMNLQISELIKHFEKAEEHKEGNYHMLKTDTAKYSVVEDNVAHDFKNDVTYNNITLLQKHYKTQNLNAIARELEKETGESYVKTNVEEVQRAVEEAMQRASNDKALEESLKEHFDVKYCKFDTQKDTITIADREIKLSEIERTRQELIEQFRANREREKKKWLSLQPK